jgi:Domain of Unknown Function with PDB structure (DUF3857)/Transglutaminase-like superfamily
MRFCVLVPTVAFSILILVPTDLRAQFQEPTKDELQMTQDPKAPGAAAVYLNVQETTDDPLHYHSFYARVKVLQDKGKELATVEIPYQRGDFKVTDIKGRTIHPDGTVVPLEGKPEDLLSSKTADKEIGRMVFTLPSVDIGSIFEYVYQVRYDDNHYSSPFWQIQRECFVHKARYSFTPFKAFLTGTQNATNRVLLDSKGNAVNTLIWSPVLPSGVRVVTDPMGRYTVDVADVPPIPNEEWMPPLASMLYHVQFYYMSAFNTGDFWETEAKHWSKEVDHFAEPTKTIQDAVAGLVSPTDSDLDKARKLYKAVQGLDNTDYSRTKSQAELKQLGLRVQKRAEDTWNQKNGSSQDIALLYLAMLRATGLRAYDGKIVNRNRGIFNPGYLSFDQLDSDVIVLSAGGKEIVLDPGEKMCPFQTVDWVHAGASGIRQGSEGQAVLFSTPFTPYTNNVMTRVGDVSLDVHGNITGSLRVALKGQDALFWRQAALRIDEHEVEERFDRWLESQLPKGIEGHIDHFDGINDLDVNLVAVCKMSGALGSATSKRLLLPAFFFSTRRHQPFVEEEKRLEPVDMHYAETITDQIAFHLPPSLAVEGVPQDTKVPWGDRAIFVTKSVVTPNQVTIADQLLRGFTVIKSDDYTDLRTFYQKIDAAEQGSLVLTLSTGVAKSN